MGHINCFWLFVITNSAAHLLLPMCLCLPTHTCTRLFIWLEVELWVTRQHFFTFILLPNPSPKWVHCFRSPASKSESFLSSPSFPLLCQGFWFGPIWGWNDILSLLNFHFSDYWKLFSHAYEPWDFQTVNCLFTGLTLCFSCWFSALCSFVVTLSNSTNTLFEGYVHHKSFSQCLCIFPTVGSFVLQRFWILM